MDSDGAFPVGALLPYGGKLYGVTADGGAAKSGAVFSFDPNTGTQTVLYSFKGGADGQTPDGGLVAVGGLLYGTTLNGGASGGTLYSIDPKSGAETVLHRFAAMEGTGTSGRLLAIGGLLYGANFAGGSQSTHCGGACGTIFSFDTKTGVEKTVYAFQGTPDAAGPLGDLILVNGLLTGLTQAGGLATCFQGQGCGAAFSVDPTTGAESVLHAFDGTDGYEPADGLLLLGGQLYGAARSGGGKANAGTVYTFNPDGSGFHVADTFMQRRKGLDPSSGLIAADGALYGVTFAGGGQNLGAVYSLTPAGVETVRHAFQPTGDGNYPGGVLAESGGRLFGTTGYGGSTACSQGCGTIFSISP